MCSTSTTRNRTLLDQQRILPSPFTKWRGGVRSLKYYFKHLLSKNILWRLRFIEKSIITSRSRFLFLYPNQNSSVAAQSSFSFDRRSNPPKSNGMLTKVIFSNLLDSRLLIHQGKSICNHLIVTRFTPLHFQFFQYFSCHFLILTACKIFSKYLPHPIQPIL